MIRRYSVNERMAMLAGIGDISATPRWLKPPKWLRNAASAVQKKIPKGTTINVDLGQGRTIQVDASDPASIAKFRKELENAKVNVALPAVTVDQTGVRVTPPQPTPAPIEQPFGMNNNTIMLLGGAALLAMFAMRGK